ncbi:uncharacterized protein [Hyperolius riggenbachi]|uniref:uncharacterized protein isoform X2 n=1 Tax=Hyperolius riggenbachi TaxID=752182 RepID=UPI0035A2648E
MSRLSCHSQRAAAMSREEMTEMVRILDKKDYDGRKQVYKQPVIRKNYILDRVISSLEDKYHVQRTKNQLQRRWSDLKLREENVLEQIRTKIRKQKKKDRKRRERERQRQLEEDVLNEEEDNTATADGGNVNATVVKDNAGEEEVAGYPDEPDQDILAVDAVADVSQEDRLELRDLQQPGFIILVPVPNQDVGQPQTEASEELTRTQKTSKQTRSTSN